MAAAAPFRGYVCGVLSGDSLLIQFEPPCPVPLQIVSLENVYAPRYGSNNGEKPDEPHGCESFEFLRAMCIGERVTIPSNGKQGERYRGHSVFGKLPVIFKRVFLTDKGNKDVGLITTSEGWTQVRGPKFRDSYTGQLKAAQKRAQEEGRGIWRPNGIIRQLPVRFEPERLLRIKAFDALVEGVLNGTTLTLFLIPNNEYIFFQIAGCVAPSTKKVNFAEFGQESREAMAMSLLDRIIRINLCDCTENKVFVGNIIGAPNKAVRDLVSAGLAKFRVYSSEHGLTVDDYIRAENEAKKARSNIWKNFKPSGQRPEPKEVTGTVVSVLHSDVLVVLDEHRKKHMIHLNSIRVPSFCSEPLGYEGRDFLRKMVLEREVVAVVEGAIQDYAEYATVYVNGVNVAEEICKVGLAVVAPSPIECESSDIDKYVLAQEKAKARQIGLHAPELDENVEFLEDHTVRLDRELGVIEKVISGCRFVVSIPARRLLVNVGLNGVTPKEDVAAEAKEFAESNFHQRDIGFDVVNFDRAHIAYSNIWIVDPYTGEKEYNIASLMVENGLVTANAKRDEEEEEEAPPAPETEVPLPVLDRPQPKVLEFGKVYEVKAMTVVNPLTIVVQNYSEQMRTITRVLSSTEFTRSCARDLQINKVCVCASGGKYYRVIVDSVQGSTAQITYMDYGASGQIDINLLYPIPPEICDLEPQARQIYLGCLCEATDNVDYVWSLCRNVVLYMHLMYKDGDKDYVLLTDIGSINGGSLNAMILNSRIAKLKSSLIQPQFLPLYQKWKALSECVWE